MQQPCRGRSRGLHRAAGSPAEAAEDRGEADRDSQAEVADGLQVVGAGIMVVAGLRVEEMADRRFSRHGLVRVAGAEEGPTQAVVVEDPIRVVDGLTPDRTREAEDQVEEGRVEGGLRNGDARRRIGLRGTSGQTIATICDGTTCGTWDTSTG